MSKWKREIGRLLKIIRPFHDELATALLQCPGFWLGFAHAKDEQGLCCAHDPVVGTGALPRL